jgi:class 3 adenylate cyclase
MTERPRGTVTFLFTDIERSTRLWQHAAAAMPDAIARHDLILRGAVTAHGGTVYKVVGDAFQVAFPTAPAAVLAAIDAQRALATETWSARPSSTALGVCWRLDTGGRCCSPRRRRSWSGECCRTMSGCGVWVSTGLRI